MIDFLQKWVVIGLLVLLAWFCVMLFTPTDNSDESRWVRSGMEVHTDELTCVQYLSTFFGGIVPRLTADGAFQQDAECLRRKQ